MYERRRLKCVVGILHAQQAGRLRAEVLIDEW